MIKFVFLDLDDTILDFHKAEQVALANTLIHFGVEPTQKVLDLYHRINKAQWERLERGELTRDEVKVERYRILYSELGIDLSPKDTTAHYEAQLAIGHYFIDGAESLLEQLNGKYSLYIASNGAEKVQSSRLLSAGIEKYFDSIFISENLGYNKSDKRFFEKCFKEISDFDKSKAVIIGDSLTSDIKGGKNAEIKTIWFNPTGTENETDIKPDFEVFDLLQVPDILKSI